MQMNSLDVSMKRFRFHAGDDGYTWRDDCHRLHRSAVYACMSQNALNRTQAKGAKHKGVLIQQTRTLIQR